MSTDRFSPIAHNKQPLPLEMVSRFLQHGLTDEVAAAVQMFYDHGCVFESAATLTCPGNDTFSIGCGGAGKTKTALDGAGAVLRFKQGDSRLTAVPFPNETGPSYFVALERAYYPAAPANSQALDINLVTLQPEYRLYRETFGRMGHPTSVSLVGGATLKIIVDSVLPNGSAAQVGRSVKVWLKTPASADSAVAIQTLAVQHDGTNNYVATSAGDGAKFGQVAASLLAESYFVLVEGPTVSTDDLADAEELALTGTVSFTQDPVTGRVTMDGAGTSFLAQLRAGVKVSVVGETRTVLRVVSDTSAVMDRDIDVAVSGAVATRKGLCFIGAIKGNGPAATPTEIDTTNQRVVVFTLADLAAVFRRCAHGGVKLQITADASDADEPQVEVKNAAGVTKFSVDEDGDVKGNGGEWVGNNASGAAVYSLIHTFSPDGLINARLYTHSTGSASRLVLTLNAKLDAGDPTKWTSDDITKKAVMWRLDQYGSMTYTRDAGAGTWNDTGWTYSTGNENGYLYNNRNNGPTSYVNMAVLMSDESADGGRATLYVSKKYGTNKDFLLAINAIYAESGGSAGRWGCVDSTKAATLLHLSSAGAGTFYLKIHAATEDSWVDGSWTTIATFNSTGLTLPGKLAATSAVADADDAIAHAMDCTADLATGRARYLGVDNKFWVNHRGVAEQAGSKFEDDFYGHVLNADMWDSTATGTGAVELSNTDAPNSQRIGGWATIKTGTSNADVSVLLTAAWQWRAAAKPIMRVRLKAGLEVRNYQDICVGLMPSPGVTGDGIYLRCSSMNSSTPNWFLVCRSGGVETAVDTGVALEYSVAQEFEIVVESANSVKVFGAAWDGVSTALAQVTTNIPTADLKVFAATQTNTNAARSVDIDFIHVSQDRV